VPDRASHIDQAERNERLSLGLEGTTDTDWAVTTLFYAAVHLVDACLAPGLHPREHRDRRDFVRLRADLRPIRTYYRELEDRSRDARYECVPFTQRAVVTLRSRSFEPLKRHLRSVLGL
jgi:hypothetical protein